MLTKNQKVIDILCKTLNEVENDAEFLRDVNRAAEKAADLAAFRMRETMIRDEVLRRMQENVWSYLESEG